MDIKQELKLTLEQTYDIPFSVTEQILKGELKFAIEPEYLRGNSFIINLAFKNEVRLNMSFEPHKFSMPMIKTMAQCDFSQKKSFTAMATLMKNSGAKISFRINDTECSYEDFDEWPTDWNKVDIKVSVFPIINDNEEKHDYRKQALFWGTRMTGLLLSLLKLERINDDEQSEIKGFEEGNKIRVLTNKYERNSVNREICLAHYGYNCAVCGVNLERTYGPIGKNFIHVHHIIPVSEMGEHYVVDPLNDLVPVCPNCHSMLHRTDPPYTVAELKDMISRQREENGLSGI